MNTSQQSKTNGAAKDADQTQPNPGATAFPKPTSGWDSGQAADQIVHEITDEDVIKAPVEPSRAKDAATAPRAARGDDDLMSQQRKH